MNDKISAVIGTAPEALDTLQEIAEKLSDNDDAVSAIVSGLADKANTADLSKVATSGNYEDLLNKPTIPTVPTEVSAFTNDAGYLTEHQSLDDYATEAWVEEKKYLTQHQDISGKVNVADVAKVAMTGSYNDLTNIPTNHVTKEEFEAALDLVKDDWYGIMWTSEYVAPIRVGNMNMHRNLPIQSSMKRCTLKDDGTVYGYISQVDRNKYDDGRTVDYTGGHGQVMVEVPEYHFDAVSYIDGSVTRYLIKLYPYSNKGKLSKKVYIGAFEAASDDADSSATTKKLYSICTTNIPSETTINGSDLTYTSSATLYRGGNARTTNTNDSSAEKSMLGRPVTSLTIAAFRDRARNRGTGWSQQYWDAYMSVVRLYIVEYSSFNSQAEYSSSTDSNGLHVGGLGMGVSNISYSALVELTKMSPFVPCGITVGLCNNTGIVSYVIGGYTVLVPSYRGIENPFGHIWKFTDGINIYGDSENNKSLIYTCSDITKFANNTTENYTLRSDSTVFGSGGYIKDWLFDESGDFIPLTQGGSNNTSLCDYSWFLNAGWKVLLSGGDAVHGASCGWFCFHADAGSSAAAANVGGRLCYTPQN